MVFERKPFSVDEFKEFITQAFADADTNWNVCYGVVYRPREYRKVDEGHFERLRDDT